MDALEAAVRIAEAAIAGLGGNFLAAVATGTSAPSERFDLSGSTWVRVDGVKVFEQTIDISVQTGVEQFAPVQLTADGTPTNEAVWTGGVFGSFVSNCLDWSTTAGDPGMCGRSSLATRFGAGQCWSPCSASLPIYCFEE